MLTDIFRTFIYFHDTLRFHLNNGGNKSISGILLIQLNPSPMNAFIISLRIRFYQ